jgi:hypothetical protein
MAEQMNGQWPFMGLVILIMFYQKSLEKDYDKDLGKPIKMMWE